MRFECFLGDRLFPPKAGSSLILRASMLGRESKESSPGVQSPLLCPCQVERGKRENPGLFLKRRTGNAGMDDAERDSQQFERLVIFTSFLAMASEDSTVDFSTR